MNNQFDLAIRNGKVADGTGNPWFKADIGISGEKIERIGNLKSADAKQTIDASGLMVAPGFIDIHQHQDLVLLCPDHGEILSPFARQGITTMVIGNCGLSAAPLKKEMVDLVKSYNAIISPREIEWTWESLEDYLKLLDGKGVAFNIAPLVGHGVLRFSVMGARQGRPSKDELEEMKKMLDKAMIDGAFGMSAGLIYPPGMWADTGELKELCTVVAKYGGLFACHVRGSSALALEAEKEIIKIGKETGIRVERSHHEACGRKYWRKVDETLRTEEEAREEGVDIASDVIPYTFVNTSATASYPPWSLEGGVAKFIERLKDPRTRGQIKKDIEEKIEVWPPWVPGSWPHNLVDAFGWDDIRIIFIPSEKNKQYQGKTVSEIASLLGKSPFDALADLLIEEKVNASRVICLYSGVSGDFENDEPLRLLLKHPYTSICSDAIVSEIPHAALYGTFPRVIGHYAREIGLFTIEDGVRKMTSLPASRIGLEDRGVIREGAYADITIFDHKRILDKSTYSNPRQYAEGINYVIANGRVVVHQGVPNPAIRAGRVLRKIRSVNN